MSQKPAEIRLGQLLVQQQWCTLKLVTEALRRQDELRARGVGQPLGRILVELGSIDEETLREALSKLGTLHLSCEDCAYTTRVRKYVRDKQYSCPRCKKPMRLADPVPRKAPPPAPSRPAPTRQKPAANPAAETAESRPSPSPSSRGLDRPPETVDGDSGAFVGRVLGGCRLVEKIAQGGMGVIFKATQLNLSRTVAVKVLAEDLSDDEGTLD